MRDRQELLVAHDVVASIPDTLEVSTEELSSILQVLRLLSTLIDSETTGEQGQEAGQRKRREPF